jgi:ATP-binding cassette subfamily F protein uup
VDWLAHHLAARRGTLLVVTHDRWFLDAVCTATWEVGDGGVHQYEGGYAAYVLARAERERVAAVREERRQGLLRKELAWLRRGPPARTSKPRFRIEAAEALITDEPEPRDTTELLRFASSRLGDQVLDAVGRLRRLRRHAGAARRDVAARPGRPRRRSSASTARARRR